MYFFLQRHPTLAPLLYYGMFFTVCNYTKLTMQKKSGNRRLRKRYIVLSIIALLIIFRLLLPYIILHYCNKTLSHLDGYYGHIQDIDVALYRGAYQIKDMYLNKMDNKTKKQTGFFKVDNIDLSVQWKALFHGRLVGEMEVNKPTLIFTKNKTGITDVKKDTNDFRKVLKSFMPLKVNRFEINNGSIHYLDPGAKPVVDISMQKVHVLAENLNNAAHDKTALPSPISAQADVYGGLLNLNMKMNILAPKTQFDLNASVKDANLALFNNFLKAYGGFDINRGTLSLYSEFAAKDGKYVGYVKPIIKDLKVLGPQDSADNLIHKAWDAVVGLAADILKNQKKNQIATKVPIQGEFDKSNTNVMEAIWEVLKNAFIQALAPSVDNQINLSSVDTAKPEHVSLFHKIFGGGKKDKTEKNKKDNSKKSK